MKPLTKGNRISLIGLKEILLSIQYQITFNLTNKNHGSNGLLKLNLSVNILF